MKMIIKAKYCEGPDFSKRIPATPANNVPTPLAINQPACMDPRIFGGATLDTKERPIGLRNSSPHVMIRLKDMMK